MPREQVSESSFLDVDCQIPFYLIWTVARNHSCISQSILLWGLLGWKKTDYFQLYCLLSMYISEGLNVNDPSEITTFTRRASRFQISMFLSPVFVNWRTESGTYRDTNDSKRFEWVADLWEVYHSSNTTRTKPYMVIIDWKYGRIRNSKKTTIHCF